MRLRRLMARSTPVYGTGMRKTFTSSIYLRNRSEILLVFHKRFNLWVPMGGELEANESPIEAAVRELGEEAGLAVAQKALFPMTSDYLPGFLEYEEHDAGGKGWHMNFAFVADTEVREITMCNEHTAYDWFDTFDPRLRDSPENVRRLVTKALNFRR
jgi:8-oxo-dGTP diphosphatase